MNILIVDDEPIIRRSLSRAAEVKGHTVQVAGDGEEALAVWAKFAPDLVFLDVLMPRLTGPQVLQREPTPHCKVVLMSAYTGEYNLEKAKGIGADLFLAKPFDDVFEVIEKGVLLVHEHK